MKRITAIFPILLAVTLLGLLSCKETKEFDDHANWKERNTEFISGIASGYSDKDPETAVKGDSFRLLSFKLDPQKEWGSGSYVYCQVLDKGTDSESPHYTDSIRINYRVRLIPTENYPDGQVIDQSFKTASLDPTVNIPSSFRVSGLIDGVTTAVMHMHCGDFWKLYIPYGLGYGNDGKGDIPGYSALIFEINLTELAPTGQNLSPR